MIITSKQFEENKNLDVNDKKEKRKTGWGEADYISWVNAQILLKSRHPELAIAFEKNEDGSPVFSHGEFAFVQPYITNGEERSPSIFFPVMDTGFQAIPHPNACEINKAMQRATAKAIATFTGLGISCFTGEDIPSQQEMDQPPTRYNTESKFQKNRYGSPPIKFDDWRGFEIKFGKHKGKTLLDLSIDHPDYIVGYLLGGEFEFKSQAFEEACRQAEIAIKNGTQDETPDEKDTEELKKNTDTGKRGISADEEDGDDVPF